VPQLLVDYLLVNQDHLEAELKTAWLTNGAKQQGTWAELFGEENDDARNFFMSWHYAIFMNEVCKQGKDILPLPMYVNAWLVQYPAEMPGKYPNGGPVSRVMDITRPLHQLLILCHRIFTCPILRKYAACIRGQLKRTPCLFLNVKGPIPGKPIMLLPSMMHSVLGLLVLSH